MYIMYTISIKLENILKKTLKVNFKRLKSKLPV